MQPIYKVTDFLLFIKSHVELLNVCKSVAALYRVIVNSSSGKPQQKLVLLHNA